MTQPLPFHLPAAPEDPVSRAWKETKYASADYLIAIRACQTSGEAVALRRRILEAVELLQAMETTCAQRADLLSR